MKRVTGIGGIFFKSQNPDQIRRWYQEHLGFNCDDYGTNFEWRKTEASGQKGFTLWAPFPATTDYFNPSPKDLMLNFRVENLAQLLEALRAEGVQVVGEIQKFDYGSFAHVLDLEGNKVELWEPNDLAYEKMIGASKTF